MTQTTKTWSTIFLVTVILLLILYLLRKKPASTGTQTNTSVNIPGVTNPSSSFPTRNQNNQQLLRVCTYDSGEQLSLDPGAVGGRCPAIYTDIAGKSGNLIKDEIIVLPNAGNFTGDTGA